MKRTYILLLSLLLLAALLSGCECDHQWVAADCVTPKTCEKCQITEGEAWGHTWQDASCESAKTCGVCGATEGEPLGHVFMSASCIVPETCVQCGESRGESLGHSFGEWVVEGDTMSHTCEVCGYAEALPVDYSLVLTEKLTGHWDYVKGTVNGQYKDYFYLNTAEGELGTWLRFSGDNTGTLYRDETGEEPITWAFDRYEVVEEIPQYHFVITTEDQTLITAQLSDCSDREDILSLIADENNVAILYSYPLLSSAAIEGCMVSTDDGALHVLNFNEDRAVTGDLNGREISGTWYLSPVYISYGYLHIDLLIHFTEGGESQVAKAKISLTDPNTSLDEYLRYNSSFYGSFWENERDTYRYHTMDESSIPALEAAMEEAPTLLVGPWQSSRVDNVGVIDERVTQDYSITFAEDGTFTAQLDKERSGTWALNDIYPGDYISVSYALTFDGVEDSVHASVSPSGELTFGYSKDQNSYTSIHFLQMTEEKMAEREAVRARAEQVIAGTWTSESLYTSNRNGENGQWEERPGYTITIREDGTFTASLDQEYTGTWSWQYPDFYVMDEQGYQPYVNYDYTLTFDGVDTGSKRIYCCLRSSGTADLYSDDPGLYRSLSIIAQDENSHTQLDFVPADT